MLSKKGIKPCPFCGEKSLYMNGGPTVYQVRCDNCTAEGPWRLSRAGAKAAWNNRAAKEEDND